MQNKIYKISIHSFVDLITNSSTEIYIQASEKSVETVKKLINHILGSTDSKLTCDDLFTISIDKERLFETYKEYADDEDLEKTNATKYYNDMVNGDIESRHDIYIKCVAKVDSKEAKAAAKILSALNDLFEAKEWSN